MKRREVEGTLFRRSERVYVAALLFLSLALRVGFAFLIYYRHGSLNAFYADDSYGYVRLAKMLVALGRFTAEGRPEIGRTPGFPLLLSVGVLLGNVALFGVVINVIASVAIVYVTYATAVLIFGRGRISLLAMALMAVEPLSIMYAVRLLTEPVFSLLIAVFVYWLIRYRGSHHPRDLLFSSLALTLAIYIRPIAYYLPLFVGAGIIFLGRVARIGWRVVARDAILFMLGVYLLVLPWQVRNYVRSEYPGVSAISDVNLYFYHYAAVRAMEEHRPYREMQRELGMPDWRVYYAAHPEQASWPQGRIFRSLGATARSYLIRHWRPYAVVYAKGVLLTLGDPGAIELMRMLNLKVGERNLLSDFLDRGGGNTLRVLWVHSKVAVLLSFVLFLYTFLCYLTSLLGLFTGYHAYRFDFLFLILILGYFVLASGGPTGIHRFRVPMMSLFVLFSSYGLMYAMMHTVVEIY